MSRETMIKNLVFVPCSVYGKSHGALYGVVKDYKDINREADYSCFFILKVETTLLSKTPRARDGTTLEKLGGFEEHQESVIINLVRPNIKSNVMTIWLTEDSFHIRPNVAVTQEDSSSVIIIVYDDEVFKHSELIIEDHDGIIESKDHFQVLAHLLHEPLGKKRKFWSFLSLFWTLIFYCSSLCLYVVSLARPVFQYSALGSHLHEFLKSSTWAFQSLKYQRKVRT